MVACVQQLIQYLDQWLPDPRDVSKSSVAGSGHVHQAGLSLCSVLAT